MDRFLLLRFAHLIGLMLMSAGLIGVFVSDMRSRQIRDVALCDPRGEPKLTLFGQLKRITKQWPDTCLVLASLKL